MSSATSSAKRAKSPKKTVTAIRGLRGLLLLVNDEVRTNTLPLSPEASMELLGEVFQLSVVYSNSSKLPLKVCYLAFKKSYLLIVISQRSKIIYWADSACNLIELEASARMLASTAHLKAPASRTHSYGLLRGQQFEPEENNDAFQLSTDLANHIEIMNWNDATRALEGIMSKVLAQAQAAKLIDRVLEEHGIERDEDFDLGQFEKIGRQILDKIPHKVLRANLANEFNSLLSRIK
jgi:hypothetical protein